MNICFVTYCDSYGFSKADSGWNSERTAKERVTELKRTRVLIKYLIKDNIFYSVKYKASGSSAKKPSEASRLE